MSPTICKGCLYLIDEVNWCDKLEGFIGVDYEDGGCGSLDDKRIKFKG